METMHPMGNGFGGSFSGDQVTSYPGQATVNESGRADNTNPTYTDGMETGAKDAATKGDLPHPEKRPFVVADSEVSYDPLALLDSLHATAQVLNDALKRIDAKEDARIKRTMRGPIVLAGTCPTVDGEFIDLISDPVPEGEIWLIQSTIAVALDVDLIEISNVSGLFFLDSYLPENVAGYVGSIQPNSLMMRSGQKIVVRLFTNGGDITRFVYKFYIESVSADMVNDLARY